MAFLRRKTAATSFRTALLALAGLAALLITSCGQAPTPGSRQQPTATPAAGGLAQATATSAPGGAPSAAAPGSATPPSTFNPTAFKLELSPVARGLQQPLFVTYVPDGSGAIYVVEKPGLIHVAVNGQV